MSSEWVVSATSLVPSLVSDFYRGQIIDDFGNRTEVHYNAAGRFDGLKIEVFSNEHPPPHFRVSHAGETANFTIKDCRKINGGLRRWERNIKHWHSKNRDALIAIWNDTRPSDCPVGPYRE